LPLRQRPPPRANIIGHMIGHVDITTMSAVLGGGRAGGKVRIQLLSRVGGCAISAFELGLD
jgi:putative Ca2+/H+ antiporter (TMEM165/GDT1 family)